MHINNLIMNMHSYQVSDFKKVDKFTMLLDQYPDY